MPDAFPGPGSSLELSASTLEALGREVCDLIDDYENQHATLFNNIRVWWKWYEAEPRVKIKDFPWRGASNLVVPLIRVASDGIIARYFNLLFSGRDFFAGSTRNVAFEERVPNIVNFLNAAAGGHDFDLMMPAFDMLNEMVPIGESVLGLSWRNDVRHVLVPGKANGSAPTLRPVVYGRGPCVEAIPREQILWDQARPIGESQAVIRQGYYSWGELLAYIDEYGTRALTDKDIEAIKNAPETDSPSWDIRREKAKREGRDLPKGSPSSAEHDVRQCWLDWPVIKAMGIPEGDVLPPDKADSKHPLVPIVVTVHRRTRKVIRVATHPYYFRTWPFYDFYMRKRAGRGGGSGVCKLLEQPQRGATVMVNQAIDAVTKANAFWGLTTDPNLAEQKIAPNKLLKVNDLNAFKEITTSKAIIPEITIINLLTAIGERLSGINDPSLGRETRMGGHPAPATSTLALLQESNKLFAMGVTVCRKRFSQLGLDILTLYQQNPFDMEKAARALGQNDARDVADYLVPSDQPIYGNVQLDLAAMNEAMNPDLERQKAILVNQATSNYYAFALQMLKVIETPQTPPGMRAAAMRALEAQTKTYEKFLVSTDVEDPQRFSLNMRSNREQDVQQIQKFADLLGIGGAGQPGAGAAAAGAAATQPGVPAGSPGVIPFGPVGGVLPTPPPGTGVPGGGFDSVIGGPGK